MCTTSSGVLMVKWGALIGSARRERAELRPRDPGSRERAGEIQIHHSRAPRLQSTGLFSNVRVKSGMIQKREEPEHWFKVQPGMDSLKCTITGTTGFPFTANLNIHSAFILHDTYLITCFYDHLSNISILLNDIYFYWKKEMALSDYFVLVRMIILCMINLLYSIWYSGKYTHI